MLLRRPLAFQRKRIKTNPGGLQAMEIEEKLVLADELHFAKGLDNRAGLLKIQVRAVRKFRQMCCGVL